MELTTTFQKIATGETKQFGGSTGKLELWAKYNSQDIANNRSNVTVELRLVCSSYIGNYQATYWSISGSLSNSGNLGSGDYYSRTLGSATGNVTHESDGTKTVSFSGSFNPTAWGMTISVSGSATLPGLHKPPVLNTAEITEKNTALTTLGVPHTTVVRLLSRKEFKLHATPYDNATITKYKIYGFRYSPAEQVSNTITVDFRNEAKYVTVNASGVQLTQKVTDSMNAVTEGDIKVLINNVPSLLNTIAYATPTITEASSGIKRKSGSGVNLTDNKATLNLVGTIYKNTTDVIGRNNSITKVGYKIWEKDTSEPANYTNLTVSVSGTGAVTLSNFEISNVDFTKAYNYKIILQDNYQDHTNTYYSYVMSGTVPLGQPTWTEYKDHVDFLSATIGGNPIVESGTGYIKFYDGTMVCWGKKSTGVISWLQDGSVWYSRGWTFDNFAKTFVSAPVVLKSIQNMNQESRQVWITGTTAPSTTNAGKYNLTTYWNATDTSITASYVAIGKWR